MLVGLSRAPQFVTTKYPSPDTIWSESVDMAIVPYSACGGSATLSFASSSTQIIAVADNSTQIQVPPEPLGIKVTKVNSYLEALGVLAAYRAGVDFRVLNPSISSLRCL